MLVSWRGSNFQSQKGSERPSPSFDRELKLLTVVGPEDCACVCLKTQATNEKEAHTVLHAGVITCFQGSVLGTEPSPEWSTFRAVQAGNS